MKNIKLLVVMLAVVSVLAIGAPSATRASDYYEMPPAIVLVQDKNDKMMLKHNFESDNGINIPWNTDVDPGFYVQAPDIK